MSKPSKPYTVNSTSTGTRHKELPTKGIIKKNSDSQSKFSDGERDQKVKCKITVPKYNYPVVGNGKHGRSAEQELTKDLSILSLFCNYKPVQIKRIDKSVVDSKVGQSTKIKELKSLNTKPVVNGNWTLDTVKPRLKQFIESNDKNKFSQSCKIINENYVVDMSIYVANLDKTFKTREIEKSKNLAINKSALYLVNQLYSYGQIECFQSTQKKKEKMYLPLGDSNVVNIKKELVNDVYSLLEDLKIKPMINKTTGVIHGSKTFSRPVSKLNYFSSAKVIQWCPPQSNWNPWLAIGIHYPKSLTQISIKLKQKNEKNKLTVQYKKRINDRVKLPIYHAKNEILDIIRENSVVIIKGGTGCGKTTQVCQFILDEYISLKKGAYCNIICTQPRKVSAISIANRVAFERAEALGKSVGYTVRFDSIIPRYFGAILFCTVEILIRKLQKGLIGISHIIVDEVHERKADTEFLMIILRDMVQKYPDMKVILMSANSNLNIFKKYFKNCPIIEVPGRCYPVKEYFLEDIVQMINYQPSLENIKKVNKTNQMQVNCNLFVSNAYPDIIKKRVSMINEDSQHLKIIESLLIFIENNLKMDGAVLIFLPGWAWISDLNNYLHQNSFIDEKCSILLLHSTLSHNEQQKVFKPVSRGLRKVILSTNIAETSITIDDVMFVIDYGKVNLVKLSDNIIKFNTVWASKVNVEQRKGRAGRVQPGICFNLFTKERFNKLEDNISPELISCSLSRFALTIKLLHLGDVHTFLNKAIDPPPEAAIDDVITMLKELKCFEVNGELTALGEILAQLPIEPQLGRMMILGNIFMLGDSLSTIVAGSSTDYDLFMGDDEQNTAKHTFSGNRYSDQLAFLNAFMQWNSSNAYFKVDDDDFFDEYNLSTSVLKTSSNIKDQIINKFIRFGFPKCCFEFNDFDFGKTGIFDEPQLDMLPALLTMAFYPNVYYYKEKRKVILKTKDFAVVSRSSINIPGLGCEDKFQLPFFVFEQHVNVMCKHSTMVSPIHLLLFGAHKVKNINGSIILDDWICLEMDVKVAAAIVALRLAIEDLIVKTTENPNIILKFDEVDKKLITVLRKLCNYNAGRHNLQPIKFDNIEKGSDKKTRGNLKKK